MKPVFKKFFLMWIGAQHDVKARLTPQEVEWSVGPGAYQVWMYREMLEQRFSHLKDFLHNEKDLPIWEMGGFEGHALRRILQAETWSWKKKRSSSHGNIDHRAIIKREALAWEGLDDRGKSIPCNAKWLLEWRRTEGVQEEEEVEHLSFPSKADALQYMANKVRHAKLDSLHVHIQGQDIFLVDGEVISIRENRG